MAPVTAVALYNTVVAAVWTVALHKSWKFFSCEQDQMHYIYTCNL